MLFFLHMYGQGFLVFSEAVKRESGKVRLLEKCIREQ